MATQQAKYELLKEQDNSKNNHNCLRICILIILCAASSVAVFATWTVIYRQSLNIPPKMIDIPASWIYRLQIYSENYHNLNISLSHMLSYDNQNNTNSVKEIENEKIYPSKLGNFIYKPKNNDSNIKLVCYYRLPIDLKTFNMLLPKEIDAHLCTHLHVGPFDVLDNRIVINNEEKDNLIQIKELKVKNKNLKLLVWVGGAEVGGFSQMVSNHANRKLFIQSLKDILETYHLDGVDIDWEFPSAYNRQRQHFSQLLHEIRREYQREHRTYLLSIAAAAIEGIAYFAYDFTELNSYADYINVMSYDYHFYSKSTPFTGINSPLYARRNEHFVLSILNLNSSLNFWISRGLDKSKLIVGLPTYGHSFRLVNPYNNVIGSPADDVGTVGSYGFVAYSELCWFMKNNIFVNRVFDKETCSPYVYSGVEWISYEDEESFTCKANYIKENGFGGAMIFSLNTDDFGHYCNTNSEGRNLANKTFPLSRKVRSILFPQQY